MDEPQLDEPRGSNAAVPAANARSAPAPVLVVEGAPLPVAPPVSAASSWLDTVVDEGIVRVDAGGRVVELLGPADHFPAPKVLLLGQRVYALAHVPTQVGDAWSATVQRVFDTQRPQICAYAFERDGGVRRHEARALPLAGGQAVLAIRDVTERDRMREHVETLASTDLLTGLPNLRTLRERLARWTRPPLRPDSLRAPVQLFLVDLDRFKQTTDLAGRAIGDALLRLVAQRLQRTVAEHRDGRPADEARGIRARLPVADSVDDPELVVARVGGDQFAIAWRLVGERWNDADPAAVAQRGELLAGRVLAVLAEPTRLAGRTLFVRASVGFASSPFDAAEADALFSQAEGALARAKKAGRNQFRRHGDDVPGEGGRFPLPPVDERQLRAALAEEQFLVVYQPKFDIASSLGHADHTTTIGEELPALAPGAVLAVEALVRWRTANGALLSPQQFLPVAEASGVIRPLGDWVLRTACAEVARHAKQRGVAPGIAVNVSLTQLGDRAFVETVAALLEEFALPAGRLTLEVTETAFLEDIRLVSDALAELSSLGVRLAIDHFGVGTGGLVALRALPVDEIKIDRSFITGASIDTFDATIVESLIDLAHALNIEVTADGVERVDQIASLAKMRCDALQGYFIGEPLTATQLFALDRLWRTTPTVAPAPP